MELALDNINIHHPSHYARHGAPWHAWDLLRRDAPVFWYERDDVEPFWAVTRYADIMTVSDNPEVFINGGPRLRLTLKGKPEILRAGVDTFGKERNWDPQEPPDMVFMDNPRHRHYRKQSSWAFTQSGMRKMTTHFESLANRFTATFIQDLKTATARGESHDIVKGLACKLPLAAIGEIMGLAADDWKQILTWSNAMVGEVEDEDRRPGESLGAAAYRSMYELRSYIEALITESREIGENRGGLIDRMVHEKIQGEWLSDQQLNGYLMLLIAAGNDTTRNALSGGVEVLLRHPDQCDLLCSDPTLIPSAVEEILRWTSPVGNFLRTATEDFDLAGTTISGGDTVGVFYPSANRDERVFNDPYRFDITRTPNAHLAFGFGAHFCLGTNLARAELKASLEALLPYLNSIALDGEPERIEQTHVIGYSTLPMRHVEKNQ
ncbi:MAG: cytochrome P450 [Gammaproteobacteria bacterium]